MRIVLVAVLCAFLLQNYHSRANIFVFVQLLKEHNVFVVVSNTSVLDRCTLPVGIRLFVSAGHSESDMNKVCESLKLVVPAISKNYAQ